MVSNLLSDRNPSSRGSVDMAELEYRDKEYILLHLGTYFVLVCAKRARPITAPFYVFLLFILFGEDTFDRDDVRQSQRHFSLSS
jgi:hypothetical protein